MHKDIHTYMILTTPPIMMSITSINRADTPANIPIMAVVDRPEESFGSGVLSEDNWIYANPLALY